MHNLYNCVWQLFVIYDLAQYTVILFFNKKKRGIDLNLNFSVQFSHSVVSDSLQPHKSQHARPPCPSPTPRVHSDSRPSSQWCHPAISSSVVPFSSCPQYLQASECDSNVLRHVSVLPIFLDIFRCQTLKLFHGPYLLSSQVGGGGFQLLSASQRIKLLPSSRKPLLQAYTIDCW